MKRINVVLKAKSKVSYTPTNTIELETREKILLTRVFDFEPALAAYVSANPKLDRIAAGAEFYKTLSVEEQQMVRTYNLVVQNDADFEKTLTALRKSTAVEDAREDVLQALYFTPNDALLNNLWAMPKIKALNAWDISRGQGVIVAVCDTGIDGTHPDIAGNLWNDGSGNFGYDFSDNDTNPKDYHGHGTHVAGTIAALGNNSTGVIGVAFNAKVMSVKIFPNAYYSVCAQAIRYAADHGARVINCSWGPATTAPVAPDPTLKAAIDYAYKKNCFCVFAAGNNDIDCSTQFPANYDKVITVASTNTTDAKSSFSNFGVVVDIAAPGENILSLKMGGSYVNMSGTSMAAPHVTGAVALLLALAPGLSFTNIRYFLQKSADPISTPQNISGKRLNLYRLVAPAIQTYKRQTTVDTTSGRFALHTSGNLSHIVWTGSTWVQNTVNVWGGAIQPGSMINMGYGRVAAINKQGNMVNTYGSVTAPGYAPLHETFGLVAGTLRYATPRDAYFAVNVFNDIAFMRWVGSMWQMDIIPNTSGPIVSSSVELSIGSDHLIAITARGTMVHTWSDPNGTLLADGTRATFSPLPTSNLIG
jgi:thermitase